MRPLNNSGNRSRPRDPHEGNCTFDVSKLFPLWEQNLQLHQKELRASPVGEE